MSTSDPPAHRLAQLPGFDTAPDVYETPDPGALSSSSDTAATPHTSRSTASPGAALHGAGSETSEDEEDEEEDDEEDRGGVSSRRLHPSRARSRFGAQSRRGLETQSTDLSDRVDGRRRGYGIAQRDEDEALHARIARLRREAAECQVLIREHEDKSDSQADGLAELNRMLAGLETAGRSRRSAQKASVPSEEKFHDALPAPGAADDEEETEDDAGPDRSSPSSSSLLSRISAFDSRLASLETALGISSSLLDDGSSSPFLLPVLPSLSALDARLASLSSASSLASLDALAPRIARLKSEAKQISFPPPPPPPPPSLPPSSSPHPDEDETEPGPELPSFSKQDLDALRVLSSLLPTLQSLSPTVPALVARLRSLRALHATAARASADLDAAEKAQEQMGRELNTWRQGLEGVERAVHEADAANGRNGTMVRGWVEELENRVRALGGK